MPAASSYENEAVEMFKCTAERYCQLIESHENLSSEEFLTQCAVLVSRLFSDAIALPMVPIDDDEVEVVDCLTHEQWDALRRVVMMKLGGATLYWTVFEPYTEEPPTLGSLDDDLADIYRDLKAPLLIYGMTERHSRAAVWQWRFGFTSHWGQHCAWALPAIYSKLKETLRS